MYRADAYFSHAINNACACCAWWCTPGWTLSCIMLSCIMPSWTLPATGHARTGIRGHAAARSLGLDYMQVEGIHHDALSNIRSSHPPARPWPRSPGRQTGFGDINNFGDPEEVHAWHAGRSCRGRVVDGAAGWPASSAAQRSAPCEATLVAISPCTPPRRGTSLSSLKFETKIKSTCLVYQDAEKKECGFCPV